MSRDVTNAAVKAEIEKKPSLAELLARSMEDDAIVMQDERERYDEDDDCSSGG